MLSCERPVLYGNLSHGHEFNPVLLLLCTYEAMISLSNHVIGSTLPAVGCWSVAVGLRLPLFFTVFMPVVHGCFMAIKC